MQDYKETYFTPVLLLSVLLTSCVNEHLIPDTLPPSSVQTDCPLKMEKPKTKVTVTFEPPRRLLVLHESPSDVQTVCSASTLQALQERLTSRGMQ